jgi:AraC family transcriptional regulator
VRAYGGVRGRTVFSIQLPAFAEDLVILQLNESAAATVTLDSTYRFEIVPGDLIVLPRGQPAHIVSRTAERSDNLIIALPPSMLTATAERDLDGHPQRVELRPFMAEQRDLLLHGIGWALRRQLEVPEDMDQLYLESLIATLAYHVMRTYAADKPSLSNTGKYLSPTILRRVCDYIEANLDHDLTLEQLGEVAQYSPYHLARLFRNSTGHTLHQYITVRRLANARLLLETTDLPLHQIARLSGFSDQGHLGKHYRRVYGHAPSAGRKG